MLDSTVAKRVIQYALGRGGHFAELFVEENRSLVLSTENGEVQTLRLSADLGGGVRVIDGETVGFTYTEDTSLPALLEAAATARLAAENGGSNVSTNVSAAPVSALERKVTPFPATERLQLMQAITQEARQAVAQIQRVTVELVERSQKISVTNSEGVVAADTRWCLFLLVTSIARSGDRIAVGQRRWGATVSGASTTRQLASELGAGSAKTALTLLDARPAPAGRMPVVLGPGAGGVLIHEAVGHPFEGDYVARGESFIAHRLGERVAPPWVTIWDDPTLPDLLGSYGWDDEGTAPKRTSLVDNGYVAGFLLDRMSATRLGMSRTGHARREGYRKLPSPRMSNTCLAPGVYALDEIIQHVRRGIYVAAISTGQVDAATGSFVFRVNDGHLIEDGRVTAPVQEVTLAGTSQEVLSSIEMVGGEVGFRPAQCTKSNQTVEITAGAPGFLVRELTVGGTSSRGATM